jgi:hypothetical protein
MDLTEIITGAVHDAEDGIIDPTATTTDPNDISTDRSEPVETATTDSPEPIVEEVSPSAGEAAVDPAAAPTDDLTKELESMGIKAPIAGQRENRIPYSRVAKIVENSRKKLITAHTEALKASESKSAAANERLKNMHLVDNLINTDPQRYIAMLANVNPAYKRFLEPVAAPAAAVPAAVVPAATDPAPQPDAQFPDGSKGYTPEGLQKLLDWQARNIENNVTAKVTANYDKRFGPIERERAAAQHLQEKIPVVRAQIQAAKQTWGGLWTPEAEAEIVKVMAANPRVSFEACAAHVLVPKSQVQRTSMRAEILKEINARPKAAAKAPAAASAAAVEPVGPRTMEQVIADSLKGLKR